MEIGGCFYNLGVDKTFHTKTQRNSKNIRRVEKENDKWEKWWCIWKRFPFHHIQSFANHFWEIKAKIPEEEWPNDVSPLEPLEERIIVEWTICQMLDLSPALTLALLLAPFFPFMCYRKWKSKPREWGIGAIKEE